MRSQCNESSGDASAPPQPSTFSMQTSSQTSAQFEDLSHCLNVGLSLIVLWKVRQFIFAKIHALFKF